MSKTIKELKAEIKELNKQIDAEIDEALEFKNQRDFHRQFIVNELQKQTDCKNGEYWAPKEIINRIARHMAAAKNWYW